MEERGENSRKGGKEQPLRKRRQTLEAEADQDFISPSRHLSRGIGEVLLCPLEKGNRERPKARQAHKKTRRQTKRPWPTLKILKKINDRVAKSSECVAYSPKAASTPFIASWSFS
jgi:hypothetical protein